MAEGGEREHDEAAERGLGRAASRLRVFVLTFVIAPMVVALLVWLWVHHERGKIREEGFAACVAQGRDAAWCEAAADKHHDRCMELTFRPSTRTGPRSFDQQGYVECLDIGDKAYWKLSAERAAARRSAPRP
jgi:hypothetical protein